MSASVLASVTVCCDCVYLRVHVCASNGLETESAIASFVISVSMCFPRLLIKWLVATSDDIFR